MEGGPLCDYKDFLQGKAIDREGTRKEEKEVEYLKKAQPQEEGVTQSVRDAVSEILSAVEKEGIAAVRRYSERLDDWNPESFVVSEEEIRRAEESIDDELKGHIKFAQKQVENFARLQRETLVDFERETLPGVILGQKQIPVNAVGSYTPSGLYPMFGSSIMTVAVAKVAGRGSSPSLHRVEGRTASRTASTSRCSTRWLAAGPTRYCASAVCRLWPQSRLVWRRWNRWT